MSELTAKEAKEITKIHNYDPFVISLEHMYQVIRDKALTGTSNCYFTVPEEHLFEIKKEIEEKGYQVHSEQIYRKDLPQKCNNIFERYPRYKDMHHVVVEWH